MKNYGALTCPAPFVTITQALHLLLLISHLYSSVLRKNGNLRHCGCLAQVVSIVVAGAGSFALMRGPFPMINFFIAGTLVYMGTIVLEGVSMSLTSKVSPQLACQCVTGARRTVTLGVPELTSFLGSMPDSIIRPATELQVEHEATSFHLRAVKFLAVKGRHERSQN